MMATHTLARKKANLGRCHFPSTTGTITSKFPIRFPVYMIALSIISYRPTPPSYFGGVTAFSTNDFQTVNGFSNSFWGWGAEDDQLYLRVKFHNMTVARAYEGQPSLVRLVRYKTLSHKKAVPNPERKLVLKEGSARYKIDGLNDLRYKRIYFELKPLYTHIIVDIQPYGDRNMSSVS